MKLTDIATVPVLTEGKVDINALMALQCVVQRGAIGNKFEELVLAKFGQLVKDGTFWSVADPLYTNATSASVYMISVIRALPADELRALASHLLGIAQSKNSAQMNCCTAMSVQDWIKMVTAREATD